VWLALSVPPYSTADRNGNCQCITGYRKHDGQNCALCPNGQIAVNGECTFICGVNEAADRNGKCQCNAGYGRYNGICSTCPANFFLANGFCVTCPLYAEYDDQQKTCVCGGGTALVNGLCQDKCPQANEVYSVQQQRCICYDGLGRVNGVCQICPTGSPDPVTQACSTGCSATEQLQGGACVCRAGLGRDISGRCTDCTASPRSFLLNGYCVMCPLNQIVVGWHLRLSFRPNSPRWFMCQQL
jgi:hypothetical protein